MIETFDQLLGFDGSQVDAWILANLWGPAEALIPLTHDQQLALLSDWAEKAGSETRFYLAYFPVNFFESLRDTDVAAFYERLAERAVHPFEPDVIRETQAHVRERSNGN